MLRNQSKLFIVGIILAVLLPVLAACGGTPKVSTESRLLAWIGEGSSPTQKNASTRGQVAYINADGSIESVLDVPANAEGVTACGNQATSPSGQYFAFFVNIISQGEDRGTLYHVDGAGEPRSVADVHSLTCTGGGTFQYSPDGNRLGFVDYENNVSQREFATGELRIFDTGGLGELFADDDVTTFQLFADSAIYIRFFANSRGNVDEAGVFLWDGSDTTEITTMLPDRDCRFTSAQVLPISENEMVVLTGQKCIAANQSSWQFYTVDLEGRSSEKVMEDEQPGGFFPANRTNNLVLSTDASTLFFTVPDGLTQNTVRVIGTVLDDISDDRVVAGPGAVMPRYVANRFVIPEDAPPVRSPDGIWWAMIVDDANGDSTLTAIELSDPNISPIRIPTTGRGDKISYMEFSRDSAFLYYIAGGEEGEENALFRVDLAASAENRIARGQYGPGAVTPEGSEIVLMGWEETDERPPRPYTNLVAMPVGGGDEQILFDGLVRDDAGEIEGRRFAFPLSWRQ